MKTLEQLLAAWEDAALNAEDIVELKRLLARPEARAELVGDWLLHGAIYECLREERTAKESAAQQATGYSSLPSVAIAPSNSERGGVEAPFWSRFFPRQVRPETSFAWRWAAVCAAVVALAGWVGWPLVRPHSVAGVLIATHGEVWVTAAGQTNANKLAGARLTLHTGDAIQAGSNALAQLTYLDGSALTIYRGAQLIVGSTNSTIDFELVRGAVDADIRPQPVGRHIKATTKFMRSDIVGTEFRLMAGFDSAWLGVRRGKVEVTRVSDGKSILLGQANYAAVHPKWPYMRMNALMCPVWKSVCRQAAGSAYP